MIVFTTHKNSKKIVLLKKKGGVEIITVACVKGKCSTKGVLDKLAKRGVQQILVEGGEKVITSFLKEKLADEIVVYTSNERLGKKGSVKNSGQMKKTLGRLKKKHIDKKRFNKNVRLTGLANSQ